MAAASAFGAYERTADAQDLDTVRQEQGAQREAQARREALTEMRNHAQSLNQHLGGMENALRYVAGHLEQRGATETSAAFTQIANGVRATEHYAVISADHTDPMSEMPLLTQANHGFETAMAITENRRQSREALEAINAEVRMGPITPREARAMASAVLAAEPETYQPPASLESHPEARTRTLDLDTRLGHQEADLVGLLALYVQNQPYDAGNPDRASGMFIQSTRSIPYPDAVRLYREISRTGGLNKNVWELVRPLYRIHRGDPLLSPAEFDRLIANLETLLPLVLIDDGERMEQAQRRQRAENAARSAPADERQAARPSSQPNLTRALSEYDLPRGPARDAADAQPSLYRNTIQALRNDDPPRNEGDARASDLIDDDREHPDNHHANGRNPSHHHRHRRRH